MEKTKKLNWITEHFLYFCNFLKVDVRKTKQTNPHTHFQVRFDRGLLASGISYSEIHQKEPAEAI